MLVLSRKKGEVITIGKSVTVQILEYERGVVSLGIDAPRNIPVHRKEVFDSIVEQNKQALKMNVSDFKKALINTNLLTEKQSSSNSKAKE
jgi:carbon storage regulator